MEVGVKSDGSTYKQDQFIWLTNETITCGKDAEDKPLTGLEKCK